MRVIIDEDIMMKDIERSKSRRQDAMDFYSLNLANNLFNKRSTFISLLLGSSKIYNIFCNVM